MKCKDVNISLTFIFHLNIYNNKLSLYDSKTLVLKKRKLDSRQKVFTRQIVYSYCIVNSNHNITLILARSFITVLCFSHRNLECLKSPTQSIRQMHPPGASARCIRRVWYHVSLDSPEEYSVNIPITFRKCSG